MDVILLPNWIENVLTVKGETEDLLMFLDKHLIGSWFKFDTVIPQPVTREECPKEYLVSDEIESHRLKEDPPMSYPGDKTWFAVRLAHPSAQKWCTPYSTDSRSEQADYHNRQCCYLCPSKNNRAHRTLLFQCP